MWGTAGIFVDGMKKAGLAEMQIVLARALCSVIMLSVFILIKKPSLFKIRLKDAWLFVCAGLFSIVMFNFCYYKTMALSTLSVAAVLLYTAPIFVAIMSVIFFKEKITAQKCIACIFAFIGCCFVSGLFSTGHSISGKCLVYGLLTGFGYSLYTIFGNILIKRGYDSITITFYTFVVAMLGCSVLARPIDTVTTMLGTKAIIYAALMALINTVVPYILYTSGLKSIEASRAPIIATVEPVVATIVGTFAFGQEISLHGVVGIFLVIGSVILLNINLNKKVGALNEGKSIRKA